MQFTFCNVLFNFNFLHIQKWNLGPFCVNYDLLWITRSLCYFLVCAMFLCFSIFLQAKPDDLKNTWSLENYLYFKKYLHPIFNCYLVQMAHPGEEIKVNKVGGSSSFQRKTLFGRKELIIGPRWSGQANGPEKRLFRWMNELSIVITL